MNTIAGYVVVGYVHIQSCIMISLFVSLVISCTSQYYFSNSCVEVVTIACGYFEVVTKA